MIEQCDFVRYLLNLVKYYIKIDYTIDTFHVIGNYCEQNNFKTLVYKTFGFSQSVITEYQNVRNEIASVIGNNIAENPTISTLLYFSVFDLLKKCLDNACTLKHNKRMSGKVSV